MALKIASLNLCLGLKNKTALVRGILTKEMIDIACLQEVEIKADDNSELLNIPGFVLEVELNDVKARVGTYIKDSISYSRRTDLEGSNSHVVIVDINGIIKTRIINLYRCFNPQEGISAREKFLYQINLIKLALTPDTILLGDFNLNFNKHSDAKYDRKNLFKDFDEALSDHNLTQLINFPTWSRIIEKNVKSSILDHIYVKDPSKISMIRPVKPSFGDHVMIIATINENKPPPEIVFRKSIDVNSVQNESKCLENELIDGIVSHTEIKNNLIRALPPANKTNEINIRKRLVKKLKVTHAKNVKAKSRQICNNKLSVHRGSMLGNSKSLKRLQ